MTVRLFQLLVREVLRVLGVECQCKVGRGEERGECNWYYQVSKTARSCRFKSVRLLSGLGNLRDCCLDWEKDKIVFTLPVASCWAKEVLNDL